MKRLSCLVGIIMYLMITASSVILFLVLANWYEFNEPLKLFSFIVIWLIASSIVSVVLVVSFYRIDDWITPKDKKNGNERLPY